MVGAVIQDRSVQGGIGDKGILQNPTYRILAFKGPYGQGKDDIRKPALQGLMGLMGFNQGGGMKKIELHFSVGSFFDFFQIVQLALRQRVLDRLIAGGFQLDDLGIGKPWGEQWKKDKDRARQDG
jgi:hypothetical protein